MKNIVLALLLVLAAASSCPALYTTTNTLAQNTFQTIVVSGVTTQTRLSFALDQPYSNVYVTVHTGEILVRPDKSPSIAILDDVRYTNQQWWSLPASNTLLMATYGRDFFWVKTTNTSQNVISLVKFTN